MTEASPMQIDSSPPSKVAPSSPHRANGSAEAGPSRSSSSAKKRPSLLDDSDSDLTEDDDDDEPSERGKKVLPQKDSQQARERYHADLKKHTYEPPKAERPQDDWQVAYIWAFIAKFRQREKIPRLECLEDFERSLMEPVANRPDDVLEGVLIRFLRNLKPGLRQLDCTNIQHHLSNYISDALQTSPEFTVWDRPWAPNEEPRGVCCNPSEERLELGRLRGPGEAISERMEKNPIKRIEAKGGGIFEMDWHERVKMLRQLVDWQLTHSETIRADISADQKLSKTAIANGESIRVEPVGQDRDKNRIWALDTSGRLYKSGNPFKRPCPIFAISSNRTEMAERMEEFKTYGESAPAPPKKGKGAAPKNKAESMAHKKLLKGIEDEKNLAEGLEKLMPDVEKEDTRIQRARRRIQQAAELASMAEIRSTRTRRNANKVNYLDAYVMDDFDDYYEDEPRKRRNAAQDAGEWRPVVAGERSSARLAQSNGHLRDSSPSSVTTSNGGYGMNGDGGNRRSGRSGRRGEDMPFEGMSEREKARLMREQEEAMRQIEEQRRNQEEKVNGDHTAKDEEEDEEDEQEDEEDVSMEDERAADSTIEVDPDQSAANSTGIHPSSEQNGEVAKQQLSTPTLDKDQEMAPTINHNTPGDGQNDDKTLIENHPPRSEKAPIDGSVNNVLDIKSQIPPPTIPIVENHANLPALQHDQSAPVAPAAAEA